jgi:DNA-binding XRE family transcriptional regulator
MILDFCGVLRNAAGMPIATTDLRRIAATVRSHRAVRDWTQAELARKAGVSRRTVEAIEAAHYRAYDRTYARVAVTFGITLAELLGQGDQ